MIAKVLKSLFVIAIFLLIFSVPAGFYLIKIDNDTLLGDILRRNTLKDPQLLGLFNMNAPGDKKYYYLDLNGKAVSVAVASVNSKTPNPNIGSWVGVMIDQTTMKDSKISDLFELDYHLEELLTDEDLNKIRQLVTDKKTADLYIVYASSYSEKPSSVGLVIHCDTIFIFKDAINVLSEKEDVLQNLERTTIMHEWGHLLGLEHVENPNCIMYEKADVYDKPSVGEKLPTQYCWEELQALKI